MIRISGLTKTFHRGTINENRALSGIELAVKKCDFISIIGSNGAGKTTLFNLISGSMAPSSGAILIDNQSVTGQPEYRRAIKIGRIFQDPTLGTASSMSIEQNLLIAYRKGIKTLRKSLNHTLRKYFRERLRALNMQLENRLSDPVGLLSGGQRQALTLLMAVLSEPDLLLLDEHTAALDPHNAEIVLQLTEQFVAEYHLTTMMITHNMQQAIKLGNRLIMMDSGEFIFEASDEHKQKLTINKLIRKFHQIRHAALTSDETLLTE